MPVHHQNEGHEKSGSGNLSMVVVTQEMGFARELANHLIFLRKGLVGDEGPAAEVFTNPKGERLGQLLSGSRK